MAVGALGIYVALQLLSVGVDLAYGEIPYVRTALVIIATALVVLLVRSIRRGPAMFMGWRALAATLLGGLSTIWYIGVVGLVLLSWVAIFVKAGDVWEGIAAWQAAVNPLNPLNFIALVVLLAPGMAAAWVARKIRPDPDFV